MTGGGGREREGGRMKRYRRSEIKNEMRSEMKRGSEIEEVYACVYITRRELASLAPFLFVNRALGSSSDRMYHLQ